MGSATRQQGRAQDLYGQAKEAVSDAARVMRQGAVDAEDHVRRIVERRPYTTAFAALCVGWLIGRMGRRS
jgi:ElaB/YqjD/DUF883 family membrane-anchored ribosome-binding protein